MHSWAINLRLGIWNRSTKNTRRLSYTSRSREKFCDHSHTNFNITLACQVIFWLENKKGEVQNDTKIGKEKMTMQITVEATKVMRGNCGEGDACGRKLWGRWRTLGEGGIRSAGGWHPQRAVSTINPLPVGGARRASPLPTATLGTPPAGASTLHCSR